MKNLKKLLAAITLTGIIMLGVSSVNAGIIMTQGAADTTPPCTETKEKVDNGIIMTLTGIIMTFTGIIMTATNDTPTDCGIIMTNN